MPQHPKSDAMKDAAEKLNIPVTKVNLIHAIDYVERMAMMNDMTPEETLKFIFLNQ